MSDTTNSYVRCPTCKSESCDFARLVHAADCKQIGTNWRYLHYFVPLAPPLPDTEIRDEEILSTWFKMEDEG